jgi:hypothetical protein
MRLPTKSEVDAATRHVGTAIGVAITIFGLQAKGVNMDAVKVAIESMGATVNALIQLIGAIGVVYGGIQALRSASPTNQIAQVQAIAIGPSSSAAISAQKVLIEATSAIAQDPSIPASVEAKNTLIAATIALPEVQTIVTDAKTAAASPSPSVVPAAIARVS